MKNYSKKLYELYPKVYKLLSKHFTDVDNYIAETVFDEFNTADLNDMENYLKIKKSLLKTGLTDLFYEANQFPAKGSEVWLLKELINNLSH